jgi:hypothetical protein
LLVGGGSQATNWVDIQGSFETNEVAINWNGALIYALASFVVGPDNKSDVNFKPKTNDCTEAAPPPPPPHVDEVDTEVDTESDLDSDTVIYDSDIVDTEIDSESDTFDASDAGKTVPDTDNLSDISASDGTCSCRAAGLTVGDNFTRLVTVLF